MKLLSTDACPSCLCLKAEAKGSQWSATFTPTRAASQLSRAPHFKSQVNATVRLSDVSGKPHISDADAKSPAKAVSVRFHAPDGAPLQADVITRSVDAFPVRPPAEYLETLRALKAGGAVKAAYFKAHPFVEQYLKQKIYIPSSYVRATYYFANAVVLVAANGTRTTVRYRIVPTAAEAAESTPATIEPAAAARLGPSFLEDEIAERIAPGGKGAEFVLVAQIAAPGDLVDDCTKIWPADRPIVELGTVKLEEYLDQDAPAQERIIYNPWPNVDGVEPSNDPLLFARNDSQRLPRSIPFLCITN